jgi:hypothetical protein
MFLVDPGNGFGLFSIPDPAVRKAPDPGSATLILAYFDVRQDEKRYELQECIYIIKLLMKLSC